MAELSAEVDNRIAGGNPATDLYVYSDRNYPTSFTRNPTCWAADIDLTCITAWNSGGGEYKFGGALISPKHVALAAHASPGVGATMAFVQNDDTIVTRTIASMTYIASDLNIATLSSALPSTITPALLFNRDDLTRFFGSIAGTEVPCVIYDQEGKLLVHAIGSLKQSASDGFRIAWYTPTEGDRADWHETIIGGDSGGPVFLVYDGELIAIGTAWTATTGASLPIYSSEVDALVTSEGESVTFAVFADELLDTLGLPLLDTLGNGLLEPV